MLPGMQSFILKAPKARAVFLGPAFDAVARTVYNFAQPVAASPSPKNILIGVYGGQTAARVCSSVTWNGISATRLLQGTPSANVRVADFWLLVCPPSAVDVSANIVVTFNGAMLNAVTATWRLDDVLSFVPRDTKLATGANGISTVIAVEEDGVVACLAAGYKQATTGYSFTWIGPAEDFDQATSSQGGVTGASYNADSPVSLGVTVTPSAAGLAGTLLCLSLR